MKINSFVQPIIKFFYFCVENFYIIVEMIFVEILKKYALKHKIYCKDTYKTGIIHTFAS